ncbi:MFS transporter [Glutamicibacter halophytocola]|uniref:MFS transporter n=1 Tax=Glutamicibacter halophytocola TaxID=1933880 RepID=A0AA94XQT1_9MICC|nr:MFS transporter [Glutamicibacter halophytocola]UUX58716.1 MFS transporter [Glutamicibacter halophytocola]
MSHSSPGVRIPLRLPTASATFAIAIAGYLAVNLSPYMITALQGAIGADFVAAGWIVTLVLLATAIIGLAVAPLCAGRSRMLVARGGLALGVLAFGIAAMSPSTEVMIASLLLGGAGAGGAVAASGAAFAAFANPDRVAGLNGLANRGVITVVLAVVPMLGLAPINVFGALALFCLIGLALSPWLPQAPITQDVPQRTRGGSPRTADRRETRAGLLLLAAFALWAVTEDSLWAMGGVLGDSQAGITAQGLGFALSGSTAGGLIGSMVLMIVGGRIGRAVPMGILMLLGSILKLATGFATDPVVFILLFIAWNTTYAVVFMYFVAVAAALAADGRWSGPLLAVYLIGSSLTPVIGAGLLASLGNQGFTLVLAIASMALAVPAVAVALFSSRGNRAAEETAPPAESLPIASKSLEA